ncbi:MAG: TolC family outer membrane protein [Nitratireductor sp.]|nr:TolC family outer membrane protein [Nitratireductor sp.]
MAGRVGSALVAFGFTLFSGYFSATAMPLDEAVRLAVSTNPKIEAAEATYRATEETLNQALGRLLPEINVRLEYGKQKIDRPEGLGPNVNNVWRNNRSATATFRQVLLDGFDRANDIYRSRARIDAASGTIKARSEAVALAGVEAYIDIVRHGELLSFAYANVKRHEELAQRIRASFSGGNAPVGDLQQTEERVEAAKSLVAQIKISLETAKAKFRTVVGVDPDKLSRVSYPDGLPRTFEEAVQLAVDNNPRIRASLSEIDVGHYDQKQFESSLYPQLSLEGSATRGEDLEGTPGRNDELKGMLVLSWKVFDGGVRRSRARELSERTSALRAEHEALLRDIREDVQISWIRYTEGRGQVTALRRQFEQNNKLVKTYLNEYEAGKRSLLDVLDAQNTQFRSRYELSNAEAIRLFSSYEMLANMGSLLRHFGIEGDATVVDGYSGDFGLKMDDPLGVSGSLGRSRQPITAIELPPLRSR